MVPLVCTMLAGGAYLAVTQYPALSQASAMLSYDPSAPPDSLIEYGVFLEMENLVVNPAGSDGRRYLMVSIGLEAERQAILDETESRDIVIRDLIIRSLSNRTAEELSDIRRREEIKEALVEEINTVLRRGDITRLYFTEYVLQ